jgi:hypothetical protein
MQRFQNEVPQGVQFHSRYGSLEDMNRVELSKYLASIGSKGGKARAKALTKKEQRAIALKASKAAAKARKEARAA